jgi:UTP--glucose-1-phosphate uridylyltransferase
MGYKAVIVAAGYGSRLLPVTRVVPKELLPLLNRSALDFLVEELVSAGVTDILLISSARKEALTRFFCHDEELEKAFLADGATEKLRLAQPPNVSVEVVHQKTMGGTGHALLLARDFVGEDPFIVAYPDDLFFEGNCTAELIQAFEATGCSVMSASDGAALGLDLSRYGVLDVDQSNPYPKLRGIVEKPETGTAPSSLVSWGRYLFQPSLFEALALGLEQHQGGEYYHVDAILSLAKRGEVVACPVRCERVDTGTTAAYAKAFFRVALQDPVEGPGLVQWLREVLDDKC